MGLKVVSKKTAIPASCCLYPNQWIQIRNKRNKTHSISYADRCYSKELSRKGELRQQ